MSTTLVIVLVAVIVVAAIALWAFMAQQRTKKLRSRFGPEYDQAVREYRNRSSAEKALENRAERTEKYRIRTLTAEEQQRFAGDWRHTQAHFVDDPALAVREADRLVCDVMKARGYPMADFDRRAEDLSVDHSRVVRNYRAAHDIAAKQEEGRATTEELRKAMVYYRELFDELLEAQPAGFVEQEKRR